MQHTLPPPPRVNYDEALGQLDCSVAELKLQLNAQPYQVTYAKNRTSVET